LLVYLDTNVYCRPFDDQSQERIRREATAFVELIELVQEGELDFLNSEILEFEIGRIGDRERLARVQSYLNLCLVQLKGSEEQLELAKELERECNLKGRDALHIAAACLGRATYCVTCDDFVLKRANCCAKVTEEHGFKVILIGPEELRNVLKGGETL
jgi:predicted nucleic acid-binding protein